MPTRRFLLLSGVASAVIIGSGAALKPVLVSDLSKARTPWRATEETFADPRLAALAYAILAPNPHNRQPWVIQLEDDDKLVLFCDPSRLLPETDPPNRQITIGLGAFLELLRQAGASKGYRVQTELFPEGEPYPVLDDRPVAHVTFVRDETIQADPLFDQVLLRRTSRETFDQSRPVASVDFKILDQALRPGDGDFEWVLDDKNVRYLKDLSRRAWEIEAMTERTHLESAKLTRIGQKAVTENPDGISLTGPFIEAMRLAGVLTEEKVATIGSTAHQETIKFYNGLIESAMGFGLLSTQSNTRRDQVNAGAGWVRLHLQATALGLSMQPLSQALQEFPEMEEVYTELHDFVGRRAPSRVQGLFRFGYAPAPPPAPRWPLRSRLVDAS